MKKINYLLLAVLLLVVGLVNVEAKTYTSYKEGDKITVNVNDTTKLDFYVIEDSVATNGQVSAIYANVFENKYTYEASKEYVNTLKNEWNNVESVVLPSMQDVFGGDVDLTESFDFTAPSWALSKYTYWTSTETEKEGELWVWTLGTSLDGTGNSGIYAATSESYLKPVINVSKNSVVGGVASESKTEDPELKEENASTGDMSIIALVAGATILAGVAVVSYKKTKLD
ncbi:MAG: hypothetical protein IJO43_01870 [Bacilli bacterium]|nr:hypothetical protein [Bacilli bacterium]